MTEPMAWVLVAHVLGWVFWLGTDVGVFLAAKFSERSALSVETRLTVLQLGMLLDRMPRLAVPIVWGTGVLLSAQLGYAVLPVAVALPVAAIWLCATVGIVFAAAGSTWQRLGLHVQTLMYAGVIIVMGAGGAWAYAAGALPLWLAVKWYAFVVIAVAALTLERQFAPVIVAFQELAQHGASVDLDARISAGLRPVYRAVLVIYGATLMAGISGLIKAS